MTDQFRQHNVSNRDDAGQPMSVSGESCVGVLTRAVLLLLRGYRYFISPFLGHHCRFHPSCSEYMQQAVMKHGLGKGFFLGARRLGCCHPWHPGGCDPVPPATPVSRFTASR